MKYIILCMDGVSDHPIKRLNNKTPLQIAKTPYLDRMATEGCVGKMQNTPSGFKAGSDICNLSLMGYDVSSFHLGRAPYELAGMGLKQEREEVVFRCNLVHIDKGKMLDFSAYHISSKDSHELIASLNKKLSRKGLVFYAGKDYRHILSLNMRSIFKNFNPFELICEAPHNIMGQSIEEHLPSGSGSQFLIDLMNDAKKILEQHPLNQDSHCMANSIWLWSHGIFPKLEPFFKKFKLRGSVISAVDLVRGIGHLLKMEVLDVPGITGYYDTDYSAKGAYAIESLKEKDFVFIHVESTDEAGHNGDLNEKIKAIENIDQCIVGKILKELNPHDYRILVAPDHPTPVELRRHTEEYVPFLLYGSGIDAHKGYLFDEKVLALDDVARYDCGWELAEEFLQLDFSKSKGRSKNL